MFRVFWNTPDDQASPLHALLVEIPNELMSLTIDPCRPQRACVQTLSTFHLGRRQKQDSVLGIREEAYGNEKHLLREDKGQVSVAPQPDHGG